MLQFQLTPHSTTESLLASLNIQHPSKLPTKHVTSDAHFINNQHSTPIIHPPQPNKFPQMRTSSTPNTQHLSPNKHVPSDAHFINTHHSTPNTQNSTPNTHQRHHILCETIPSTYQPTPQDSGQEERLKASFLKLINTRFSP